MAWAELRRLILDLALSGMALLRYGSSCLFVQDDGLVTSMVTGADGKGFLLVLDASTFEEIARAKLPYGLPYGFHNQYFPSWIWLRQVWIWLHRFW